MIEFREFTKRWSTGTKALDTVSLTIPKGQFCVILGPSGAGKSTLLRSVNGLVRGDGGAVVIAGEAINDNSLKSIRLKTSMIHQHFSLSPRLSVATNVLSGCIAQLSFLRAITGWFSPAQRRRACELLQEVGLTPVQLQERAGNLSGGQQQRVGIARAFISSPDIILADEPVASLDPKISADILHLIHATARAHGTTVLCSLHQVELAKRFADRIVGLRNGKLVLDVAAADFTAEHEALLYGHSTHSPEVGVRLHDNRTPSKATEGDALPMSTVLDFARG